MPAPATPGATPLTARPSFPRALLAQGGLALGLLILTARLPLRHLFSDPGHDLLLHLTLEFLSISTALMIFTVGWFAFDHERGARDRVLAGAFLAVALLGFLHALSYTGMPDLVTPSAVEKAINFGLPARLLSALALVAVAALAPDTTLNRWQRGWLLAAILAVTGVVTTLGLYYPDTAPRTLIPGQGLTRFKVGVEYTVMALYGVALFLLIRGWRRERDHFRALLIAGLWVLLLGALNLTRDASVADLPNPFSHLCRIWGNGLIFWAVYTQALDEPHRRLRQSQQQLSHHEQRTRTLLRENQALLDNAFIGIAFLQDRRIIHANRCAEALFGYAPGELIGVSTAVIYPDHAAFLAMGERAYPVIDRGETFAAEVELIRKDGTRFWCRVRAAALAPGEPLAGSIAILEDATERRQARQALEDAAGLWRAVIESRDVIKVLIDPTDGRIIDANEAAADFYGYPRATLKQRYAWEQNANIPREALLALFADVAAGRVDLMTERHVTHRRANGELCEVAVHVDVIRREHRNLLLATVLDLTTRKAAESALRASEERHRSALVALAEGVAVYDRAGTLITANPAAARILGLSTEQYWRRAADDEAWRIIHPDGCVFPRDTWPTVVTLRTGLAQREVPMGIINADESLTWIQMGTEPIRDPETGVLQAVAVSFSDITARKASEDALRASEERLQLVLDGSNDGFWDWNVRTGAILFSRHWAELLGYDLAEVQPHIRCWRHLIHPEDQAHSRAVLRAHFAGDTAHYQVEHRLRTKQGEWRWFLHRGKVTARDAAGRPLRMAGTHTDITARRLVEEALQVSLVTAERHDAWMVALNRMNELLLSCETRAEAYAIIARGAGQLFPGASGALAVRGDDAAAELRVVASWGDPGTLPASFPLDHCWALRRGEVHEVIAPTAGPLCRHFVDPLPAPHLCVPLTVRGNTLGLLHVSAREALTAAPFGDLRTLAVAVSESVRLTLSNLRLQETLREQTIRDPLTGLFNRRYLDEALPRAFQLSRSRGEPLAVAMLDLDHFKRFNDAYGHEAGDTVLRAVGALLTGAVRAGDLACRYGGEELTLILPGADLAVARARLDGLRQMIMQTRVLHQGGDLPTITVSIGVTVAGAQETDTATLLARADAALYQAKAAGRNRVIAAAPAVG